MRINTRHLTAGTTAILAAAALSACSVSVNSGSDEDATPENTTSAETESDPQVDDTDPDTADSTESDSSDSSNSGSDANQGASDGPVTAIDLGSPSPVTMPGTELAPGEPGWFTISGTIDGEEVGGEVGVTLLEVRELDTSVFEAFGDASVFEGYTPYAVIFEHQWYFDLPEGYSYLPLDGIYPLLSSTQSAEFVSTDGGATPLLGECGLDLPAYDDTAQISVDCMIALSNSSQPVIGMKMVMEDYGYTEPSDGNPYAENPVIWQ